MRVPDQLLKSVAFVSRDDINLDFRASAFVVSIPHDDRYGLIHLVTAKHVAVGLESGQAVLGFNGKNGHAIWMKNEQAVPWFFHPDPTVDIAVLPMATATPKDYDYQDISTTRFVTSERLEKFNLGVGDETFTIGLFAPFIGELRLVPHVRTGIVSVISPGRIPHPAFGSMEAYLVEGRSIGGLSGSPVFVRDTLNIHVGDEAGGNRRVASALGEFHLLGMVSGHWNTHLSDGVTPQNLNTAISLVVPAHKILEALQTSELKAVQDDALARGLLPGH